MVVVSDTWLTVTPLMLATGSVMAGDVPVEMARPLTVTLLLSCTVPWTVAVPVPIAGRPIVPLGGVIPMSVSKSVEPVTPCPISHSVVLSVLPVEYVPENRKMRWTVLTPMAVLAEARLLNGLLRRPSPLVAAAELTNQITGDATLTVTVAGVLHRDGNGLPLSHTV